MAVLSAPAPAVGANLLQLRAPGAPAAELVAMARVLVATGIPTVISGRADVALVTGAAGVHLPERDLTVAAARRLLGPEALVGRSVHSVGAAIAAEREGASYVVFGPVWETPSHPGEPAAGIAALREVSGAVRIPVLAIGGVTDAERVAAALAAGAAGHASIRAFA